MDATSTEILRFGNLLIRLQSLSQRLQLVDLKRRGVDPVVGREILGQAIGAIAEEIFESSSVGDLGYSLSKKWARQQQTEQMSRELVSVEYEFNQIVSQATNILSTVSIDGPSLKVPGNSERLVRRMRTIASFARLETRITRAIQFLESLQEEKLVLNTEITAVVAARRPGYQEAYGLLRELERGIRETIQASLSGLLADWWTSRVPDDVREKAEQRKKRTVGDLQPINYVDFPDYVKIIRKRDNWRDVFREIFKDEEWISVKLRELEPIRNALAHSRPLPRGDLDRLRVNAKDILNLVRE